MWGGRSHCKQHNWGVTFANRTHYVVVVYHVNYLMHRRLFYRIRFHAFSWHLPWLYDDRWNKWMWKIGWGGKMGEIGYTTWFYCINHSLLSSLDLNLWITKSHSSLLFTLVLSEDGGTILLVGCALSSFDIKNIWSIIYHLTPHPILIITQRK